MTKPRRNETKSGNKSRAEAAPPQAQRTFRLEFKNGVQKLAWAAMDSHDVIFLTGPAGTGKTHLAVAYAISEVLAKRKSKIILTRPIVEAGEKLGYLPGGPEEKVNPYMLPLYDCMSKSVGLQGPQFAAVQRAVEVAPLAFMRGRTFDDSICIFDESQNATIGQLKLFLTRLGESSKMIITGDPRQSDLPGPVALPQVIERIGGLQGVALVEFPASSIVRHRLVGEILEKLEE
jgi:phosphate starvation-inducible PhoH-like protein